MIRKTEQTVRGPVARMAPTARVWAFVQTQWENRGAKAAKMATISGGTSTGVVSEGRWLVDHHRSWETLLGAASQLWRKPGRTIVLDGQSRATRTRSIPAWATTQSRRVQIHG